VICGQFPTTADETQVLTPLTHKIANKDFPSWTPEHQVSFNNIEELIIGQDSLINIDHDNPGDNCIFVTCEMQATEELVWF